MTDDATTPLPDDREPTTNPPAKGTSTTPPAGDASPTTAAGGASTPPTRRGRPTRPVDPARRRRLIIGGVIAVAVLAVLLACVAVATVVRSGVRLADRADDTDRRHSRLEEACTELETRLNRLTPPGATGGDPRRRAQAVRDEHTALRPLLAELEAMTADRRQHDDDSDDDRDDDWASGWRQLVEARTAYADALERQASMGDPAFFLAPREPRGDAVIESLQRRGPDSCAAAVRRLGHPDL